MSADVLMAGGRPPRDRRRRRTGTLLWLVSVALAAIVIGGAAATFIGLREDVDDLTDQAVVMDQRAAGRDLSIAALRQQLEAAGIEPDERAVLVTGRDGLTVIGPPGVGGADGAPGAPGGPGADGADGSDGRDGLSVVGPQGEPGPVGPPGESIVGPVGAAGSDGQPVGSFQFVAAGVTYQCTDPDGDGVFACEQQAGP